MVKMTPTWIIDRVLGSTCGSVSEVGKDFSLAFLLARRQQHLDENGPTFAS
jgi:hypothetical protein